MFENTRIALKKLVAAIKTDLTGRREKSPQEVSLQRLIDARKPKPKFTGNQPVKASTHPNKVSHPNRVSNRVYTT